MSLQGRQSEAGTLRVNKAINRFGKSSEWQSCLHLLREMRFLTCLPDVITYSSIINACGKGQQWQQALSVLSQMDIEPIRQNAYTYSSAVAACGKGSAWIIAEALLKVSSKVFPSPFSLASAINAYQTAGQWQHARAALLDLDGFSVQPDTACFNAVVTASAHWLQAMITLQAMGKDLARPNVVSFSSAISTLHKGHEGQSPYTWPKALVLLEEMLEGLVTPNLLSYNTALDSMAKSLQWLISLSLFRALHLQSLVPDIISQSSVADACLISWNTAVGIFGKMASSALQADLEAQSNAISACATGSGWPLSLQLMAAMGEYVDVIVMSGALSACERGSWEGAVALLGVMLRCRIRPDDACFQNVTVACSRRHLWIQSLQVVQRSLAGTFDLLTITVRHVVSSVKLRVLEVAYPNTWSAREFREGVAAAFQHVNSLLDEGDFLSLRQLLDDSLLEDLRKNHGDLMKGLDYELKEVYQLGIFHSMAKVDDHGFEAVFVTPLLRVTEKYTLQKDPKIWWEVRRLHKWTFKRILPSEDGEEASDWQIVAMDKKRWRPPALKDEE